MEKSTKNQFIMGMMSLVFFMWGALTCLNDLLVPNLKAKFSLDYTQSMLVQFCFFLTYALASIPASKIIGKIGYKKGIILGLFVCALGCACFIFAAVHPLYITFLFGLFVLAAGIVCLQVAANPFVTLLGPSAGASSRLTFAQALNSLGTTLVPLVLGAAIINNALVASYSGLIIVLLVFIVGIQLTHFPTLGTAPTITQAVSKFSVWKYPGVIFGASAIFVYVGTEVSASSLLVNYLNLPSIGNLPKVTAAHYLSFFWGGALVGRFIGAVILRYIKPAIVVLYFSLINAGLVFVSLFLHNIAAGWLILSLGLFNSVMFPTIFAIALEGMGQLKSQVSGILCTAIVGGAIIPLCQGGLADAFGLQNSFALLVITYLFLAIYAYWANKHKQKI